jgi:hypothetical protein
MASSVLWFHSVDSSKGQRSIGALTLFKAMGYYRSISLVFACCMLSSCAPVTQVIYGVRSPSPTSLESIVEFKNKELTAKAQLCFLLLSSDSDIAVPEPFLFDSSGKAVDFRNSKNPACSGPLGIFLSNLTQASVVEHAAWEDMETFTKLMSNAPCFSQRIPFQDADYHLFITWATWTGKAVYRQRVKEWINAAQLNHQVRIAVYLVNMDMVQCD